jgi:hypothetical protein
MIVDLFWICVVILGSGWLYFYVARPILEAYDIVGPLENVKGLGVEQNTPKPVMSRPETPRPSVPVHQVPVPVPGTNDSKAARPDDLTEDRAWEVIALAKDERGKYKHSGKKLYATKGGSYPEFLAWLRQLRGDDKTEPPEEPVVYTPIAGRPTRASYYSEPELEYKEPPR